MNIVQVRRIIRRILEIDFEEVGRGGLFRDLV